MKKLLMPIVLFFMHMSVQAQSLPITPETPFKVYNTRTGEQITITKAADLASNVDVVFWGEEHNDTIGHILELKMLKLLEERHHGRMILSLEMFERDCQTVLDEYLGGFIAKDKFLKDARPWPAYEQDYSPMVEFAKTERIPVVAANSPRRYNSIMSKRGPLSLDSLSKQSKQYFAKLPIYAPQTGKYYKKFVNIMGGVDNIHSPNMFASQCLWDATMAQSIDQALRNGKKESLVMHVAGRFHSDEHLGTVSQLYRLNNKVNAFVISCFSAEDFAQPNWDKYAHLGDIVIITDKPGKE